MASAAGELGSGKTVLILSLVIGCFAVLWPKIFYPMLQASLSSSVDAPYSEVSGVYHSSVLPCCHPVTFTKELNALYFTELCERLQWRAGQRPDHQASERGHHLWTPGLARWCRDELRRTCGVQLDEPALERFRRAGADCDAATRNLTRCLEVSYQLRREQIRPTRQHLIATAKYAGQERPAAAMPHAAAAAAHAQAQNLRQPRRNGDRGPRPVPGMRPNIGGGYGGFIQPQPKGSGAMGIIMPIYTIGIVIFFMYTIMRVMFKKSEKAAAPTSDAGLKPAPAAAAPVGRYRVQPDTPDGRGRVQTVVPPLRRDKSATERRAVPLAAPAPPQRRYKERVANHVAMAPKQETAPAPAIPLPAKPEEAEIDQLRRRLEDTERAMERIMQQMSSVSHKLNAARISSNIRALKEELWGSVDSLASESCVTDYSLDSRAQVLTDPSLWTYSLDSVGTGAYTQSYGGPSGYSLETSAAANGSVRTAPLASAVSRLYRSVSQLSLELETAPAAEDEVSMPAETGAELSELHEGEDEVVDNVDELRHDGENAVRRFASLEALQQSRTAAAAAEPEKAAEEERQPATDQEAGADRQVMEGTGVNVESGASVEGLADLEEAIQEIGVGPTADALDEAKAGAEASGTAAELVNAAVAPVSPASNGTAAASSVDTATSPDTCSSRGTMCATSGVSELRSATCPHSFPSGLSSPSGTESALSTPRVIVLGLRTKRTPEREPPRSVSFWLGGDPGQVLASCHADGRPPESAVMIRETETRARREGRQRDPEDTSGTGLETKLELEIAGMEATSPPPRSAWAARLQAATETSLAAIEDDLKKAAQALKNVSKRVPGASSGKDTKKAAVPPDTAPTTGSGVQQLRGSS